MFAGRGIFRRFHDQEQEFVIRSIRREAVPGGAVVIPYYGSPVYRYFSMERRDTVVYGDGMMGVTADRFRQTGMGISLKIRDHDGAIHDIWIVPPFFFEGGYVNDPIYYDDDEQKSL